MSEPLAEFVEGHVLKQHQSIFWEFCGQIAAVAPEALMRMRGLGHKSTTQSQFFESRGSLLQSALPDRT